MAAQYIIEPERRVPLAGEADVIVAGAGPAGMAAALAAARTGAKVRLFEMHGCLGGVWTAGLLAWMFEMDQPGIPREISRRLDTDGTRSKGQDPSKAKLKSKPYDIPMRALVSRDVDGLLLAGRCISGDFIAHASYRVTGTAAATGQAAGVAAALSALQRIPAADLPWPEIKAKLQILKNASSQAARSSGRG